MLEAKKRGYTEPDPRDDLSGVDFCRKLVILGRQIGVRCTLSQVEWTSAPMVPVEAATWTLDHFLDHGLDIVSAPLQQLSDAAKRDNKRLVFAGTVDKATGRITCGVEAVAKDGPYGALSGANNIIIIRSDYYPDSPMVITGPGAGGKCTASAVVSDLVK